MLRDESQQPSRCSRSECIMRPELEKLAWLLLSLFYCGGSRAKQSEAKAKTKSKDWNAKASCTSISHERERERETHTHTQHIHNQKSNAFRTPSKPSAFCFISSWCLSALLSSSSPSITYITFVTHRQRERERERERERNWTVACDDATAAALRRLLN